MTLTLVFQPQKQKQGLSGGETIEDVKEQQKKK
jgi:hypothetical protein